MSTTQRKRRGGAVNSRQGRKRNRLMASTAEMASEAEPIELEESAGEEVVDLTCESSEPVVVDLTHNDSVVPSVHGDINGCVFFLVLFSLPQGRLVPLAVRFPWMATRRLCKAGD
ncbi:E3 ubiquitin-protein ligase RNF4 [Grus japonensis]|uniref:E3 ubiquitin-protein ligase RNF4 n=1 Tax=Grus japonensis TaxID=30415 RepID=A0ABC9WRZ2_GRUJA